MWPNLQFPADLVTFTEEIFNEKLHFLSVLVLQSITKFGKKITFFTNDTHLL